jgi:hypothetical protein
MIVVLGLLLFLVVLDLAALTGRAPSTRDAHDWERTNSPLARRGPVHLPAAWLAEPSNDCTTQVATPARR